jgi:cyclopropane-fatty-acyl-phospholipid synthase
MSSTPRPGAASRITDLADRTLGGPLPVPLRTWDGDEAGTGEGPVVVLRSHRAVRRLMWVSGELGPAQAYVTGELVVEGDLTEELRALWAAVRAGSLRAPRTSLGDRAATALAALRLGALGTRPPAPTARLRRGAHGRRPDPQHATGSRRTRGGARTPGRLVHGGRERG